MTEPTAQVVKARRRYQFVGWLAAIIAGLLLIATLAYGVVTQTQNRQGVSILVNCTTPGHECYERGRSTQNGAVGTITQVSIVAAWCAKTLPPSVTLGQMQNCIRANIPH